MEALPSLKREKKQIQSAYSVKYFTHQNNTINSSNEIIILGVKLDAKLSFDPYISDVVRRVSRQINILRRIFKFLDEPGRINVYRSFISANFNYCPVVWMFCGKKNSTKLEKLQERALRFVFKDTKSSYQDLLTKGNFLSLSSYRIYFLGIEMYKSKYAKSPDYIKELHNSRTLHYGLRDGNKLIQSSYNTKKYGFRSFSYYGSKLWNSIPVNVKEAESLDILKQE